MGWRYTLIVLGCIALGVFFLRFVVFRFQESPKFLLYRGRDQKAVDVLHHVAAFNKKESNITLEMFVCPWEAPCMRSHALVGNGPW